MAVVVEVVQQPKLPEAIHRIDFDAMGTTISAMVECLLQQGEQLAKIETLFGHWERTFSRFLPDSELTKLNLAAGNEITSSTEMIEVIQKAAMVESYTDGVVNFTMHEQIKQAGYTTDFKQQKGWLTQRLYDPWGARRYIREVDINEKFRTIIMPYDMHIDLGGIVKGWAAQRAAEWLNKLGPALVNAGGDLYASRPQIDGAPWQVAIERPYFPDEHIANFALYHGAAATSGTWRRRWQFNGSMHHHVLDPKTGAPAQTDLSSATIISSDGVLAEAGAKTVLILGSMRGMEWAEKNGMAAFIVLEDGTAQFNHAMKQHFWS